MKTIIYLAQCVIFTLGFCSSGYCQNQYDNSLMPYFSAVVVNNAENSSSWYQSVLGLKVTNVNENPKRGSKIIVLSSEGLLLELIEVRSQVSRESVLSGKSEQTLIQGFAKIGFKLSDMDSYIRNLNELKVTFFGNIYTDPVSGKRSFLIQDPDKNLIQFFE
jgi:hypothetical protein